MECTLANMRVHGHGVYTVSVDCSLKFPVVNFSEIKGISTSSLSRRRVKGIMNWSSQLLEIIPTVPLENRIIFSEPSLTLELFPGNISSCWRPPSAVIF